VPPRSHVETGYILATRLADRCNLEVLIIGYIRPINLEMSKFPYAGLASRQIWKRAVSDASGEWIDPQLPGRFLFDKTSRISSAGSCFALRIAESLRANGYSYLQTETSSSEQHGPRYSARYGDIYTTLQLAQLAQRAVGAFIPQEPAWINSERFYDPFRPRVEPAGFDSIEQLELDRSSHLAATQRMLRESDVFIFTLGLTETWQSRIDGAAFPLCPGAGIGSFDPETHVFHNLTVDENIAALESFLNIAWSLNPELRVILTVSPVPLAATMESRHVVASTIYSKSVLRVVAETIRARHDRVDYFASYEIVTAQFNGIATFAPNRRDVLDASVENVMESFFKAFSDTRPEPTALPTIELSLDAPPPVAAGATGTAHDLCNEAYLASIIERSRPCR
jgi:hypothetical protein